MLPSLWLVACAAGHLPDTSSSSSSGGGGGMDGGQASPCVLDCSKIETAQCTLAVCNTGQYVGPLNTCVVVPAPSGTACDDGQFCTVNDSCDDHGTCGGGTPNDCGIKADPCVAVICYEDMKSCSTTPVADGNSCTPKDLCQVNGVCHIGDCQGEPKDCKFSPLNECNKVACNSATGACEGTADPAKDDTSCVLTGDLCHINRTCKTGQCQGGVPQDCSELNVGCQVGLCDSSTGLCRPASAPTGTACSDGIPECFVGACNTKGDCAAAAAPDGTACNDHDSCTMADTCAAGICSGGPVVGCSLYLHEGFETCANGWTLGGDWQCGTPTNVGPTAAHTGTGCIGTQIAGLYTVNQSFAVAVADSPPIDLTTATMPQVSFWAWDYTEGGTFDGWNLKISIDGGQNFTEVPGTAVTPTYSLTIAGQLAWGGNHAGLGWQNYLADLSLYAGHTVILRFAFRSDGATVFPGVYVDDITVAEPSKIPLFITTPSPLPDVYLGMFYSTQISKTGGSNSPVWSLKMGGTNDGWLKIDANGVLYGTPMQLGPVSVTVHVEDQGLSSNFAEKTFTFNVNHDVYYTSFETCPSGWTLTGDWQCGVPMNVGPATAYVGSQCIGTQIAGIYNDNQQWAGTTATSPDIDLTGVPNPLLTFRIWMWTEGSTYDGVNLQVSTDGGATYSIITNVVPPYALTVAGKPAWGGDQHTLGWQLFQSDLSALAGQTIRLRFAFRSDSSGDFAGVYIDDILIN